MLRSQKRPVARFVIRTIATGAGTVMTSVAVFAIRGYQAMIRPWLVGACKFHPTCSEYAVEALHTHGPWRGAWLAVRRLARCHPFSPGGLDPVPEPESRGSSAAT